MKFLINFTLTLLLFIGLYAQEPVELTVEQLTIPGTESFKNILSPAVSFTGEYLIFTVIENNEYSFYECKKNGNGWSEAIKIQQIDDCLGATTYKNAPVYNYDASRIYFAAQNGSNTDIFYSERTPDGWSEPVALDKTINTSANEDEPSISSNDNILYFVRFTDDKKECGKIFVSKRTPDFSWGQPVALLEPLNLECERSPRVLSDNKTVLFASKRDKNKNFNIYFAKNVYSNIWFIPKQIGFLTKNDNLYPTVDYHGKIMYFSAPAKGMKSAIYKVELPAKFSPEKMKILKGKITDNNDKPLKAIISLRNTFSYAEEGRYFSNPQTGEYRIFIPQNTQTIIDITSDNYSHFFKNYDNSELEKEIDYLDAKLFDTISLVLNVFDKEIFEPMEVEIQVKNTKEENISYKRQEIDKGRYVLQLPIGEKLTIELTNDYIEPYTLTLDLSAPVVFRKFEKNAEVKSEKVPYTFKIKDLETNGGVLCEVTLVNKTTSKKIVTKVRTDKNGNAVIYVRKGDSYEMTINPQGYAFYNMEFSVTDEKTKVYDVELQPLTQNAKIELKNITFETNSAELNVNSYAELDKVIELMQKNPGIKVEISAHTDDVGSENYNLKLSERRAQSVVNYLIMHDVPKDRLIAKGYGETKPLVPNNSDENRAKNRRVELKIIETEQK